MNETYLTPFGEVALESETVRNNFRFPGQYHDRESMLYYNWNRYYIPSVGRYNAVDKLLDLFIFDFPIFIPEIIIDIQPYEYAFSNPLSFNDLNGFIGIYYQDCLKIKQWEIAWCMHVVYNTPPPPRLSSFHQSLRRSGICDKMPPPPEGKPHEKCPLSSPEKRKYLKVYQKPAEKLPRPTPGYTPPAAPRGEILCPQNTICFK